MNPVRIALLACLSVPLWSATCPAGRPSIYFGNGVNTNLQDAINSAYYLQQAILSGIAPSQSVDAACLDFKLSYDSKFLNSSNLLIQLYNLELQVAASSGDQVLQQFLSQGWAWFADLHSAPLWFKQTIADVLQSGTIIFQPDLQAHVSNYNDDIAGDNKVIVVAHSQGNLYANQAFAALRSRLPTQFALVSVATPANNVIGQPGPYVTLINDIITLVLGSRPGNTTNFPVEGGPCSSSVNLLTRLDCHAFDSSYLAGTNSHSAIVSNVISALPIVLGLSKLGPGKGTVISAPIGINCDANCPSTQKAFQNGANVTLTETPDTGSSFLGWSGDCATLATGGITDQPSITFPVFFNVSGAVITSYPENCTATFGLPVITLVNPNNGQQGKTGLNVAVTGEATHFVAGVSSVSFGAGITVGAVTVINETHLTAQISIDAAATQGVRTVIATTSDEIASLIDGFTVNGNPTAVRLNPFGNQSGTVPYHIEVVNSSSVVIPASSDITVTLLREVFSECSGLLFSSNRMVVVSQGQSSATFNFDAGHDPSCNTRPITTVYTVTNAVLAPSTTLNLGGVPSQQLQLFSIH